MPWPKTFPNPEWMNSTDPRWRAVSGKSGTYVHDDVPTQEVEILLYQCPDCGHEQQTMHSLGATAAAKATGIDHPTATLNERQEHATCPHCFPPHKRRGVALAQLKKMTSITLAESKLHLRDVSKFPLN